MKFAPIFHLSMMRTLCIISYLLYLVLYNSHRHVCFFPLSRCIFSENLAVLIYVLFAEILDRIECLSAERYFVQKSMVYLRLIADSSEGSVLEGVKEVLHFCEKTIETASSVQLSDASVNSDL